MTGRRWTVEDVRALGAVTTLPTAAEICGISAWSAYQMHKRGELPFQVLRLGRALRVPVAGLLRLLEADPPPIEF